ncbi:MAG TPA: formate dehydrogenase accessory sulfurtransferase FdhD [Ktedonobacterales bacterium]|nr:formate dehydrogenase accessory sulfurtransferase FdhD [Ktedonobacterales bacterium]
MTDTLPGEPLMTPNRSPLDPLRQVRVEVVRWSGAASTLAADELTAEEPLELRAAASASAPAQTLAVIMRTPGHDEELAAGFLYSEGLIRAPQELAGFAPGSDPDGLPSDNVLDVRAAPGVDLPRRVQEEGYTRQFAVNASCGVCGKNSVAAACAALPPLPDGALRVEPAVLCALPDRLRAGQQVFEHTGGLHAAGLFDASGMLLALREDVGRHNAVDKLVGRALLDDALPLSGQVLLVSGRLSFEIVLKALAAGIPLVAAVSAPSSLAVDLAQASNITLVGFLRGSSFNVYTHPWRVASPAGEA